MSQRKETLCKWGRVRGAPLPGLIAGGNLVALFPPTPLLIQGSPPKPRSDLTTFPASTAPPVPSGCLDRGRGLPNPPPISQSDGWKAHTCITASPALSCLRSSHQTHKKNQSPGCGPCDPLPLTVLPSPSPTPWPQTPPAHTHLPQALCTCYWSCPERDSPRCSPGPFVTWLGGLSRSPHLK